MNIKQRNIATSIILSFVTFGIYLIYWDVMLAKEAVSVRDSKDDGVLEIVLMLFLPFLGAYMVEKKLTEGCAARGIEKENKSTKYLILGLVGLGIVDFALIQKDLNMISEYYGGNVPEITASVNGVPVDTEAMAIEEITKYKQLLDAGVITQEEFDKKKQQLLELGGVK